MLNDEEYSEQDIAKAVGQALKALRQERNMSQSKVYNTSNIERNVYQRYETSKVRRPSLANLIKIAEALKITPGELIDKAYRILRKEVN